MQKQILLYTQDLDSQDLLNECYLSPFSSMTQFNSSGNKKKTTVGAVALAVLVGGYSLLRPAINEATGWNLPAIAQQTDQSSSTSSTSDRSSQPPKLDKRSGDSSPAMEREAALTSTTAQDQPQPKTDTEKAAQTKTNADSKRKPGPLASKFSPKAKSGTSPDKAIQSTAAERMDAGKASPSKSAAPSADPSLKYGLLREIGRDRYLSPQGLQYTPGSAEGHRLKHLERHTVDQPNRPGKHGVFDGGMEGALKTIEKAYEKAKAGSRTTKQVDKERTIYTVDMGKRVGYIGGRDGNRQRKPMARRVRLVLEGSRVITAFPL